MSNSGRFKPALKLSVVCLVFHAGVGFDSNNAVPMEVQPVSDLTLEGGFTMRHGGYEKKNFGLKGERCFEPPCTVR